MAMIEVKCPICGSPNVIEYGKSRSGKQRYRCKNNECPRTIFQLESYADFPFEHWTRIRTNNVIERLNREIRRRTRVVGAFPDGNSALMLVCARLRHVAGSPMGQQKIHEHEASRHCGRRYFDCRLIPLRQKPKTNLRKTIDTTGFSRKREIRRLNRVSCQAADVGFNYHRVAV